MTIFLTPKNKKYKCNKVTMTIGGYTFFVFVNGGRTVHQPGRSF